MKEPKPMQEVHEIRKKIYEETKHLTRKQRVEKIRRAAHNGLHRYGLTIRRTDKAA